MLQTIGAKKIRSIFYSLYFVFLAIVVIRKGYIFTHDSFFYINGYTSVQPAYSILLNVLKRIFGSYYKEVTIGVQFVMSYATLVYFNYVLRRYFHFKTPILIVLFIILSHPIYSTYSMCNKLVTESLATTFFLLFLASSIRWFFTRVNKQAYLMVIFAIFLQLTRAQFLSVSIALFLFVIYVLVLKELKSKIVLVLLILSIPVISGGLEKAIYGIVFGHYSSRQLGNVSLATLPFYLSEFKDYRLMPDKESKEFFICAYMSLREQKLLASQLPINSSLKNSYQYFFENFSKIMNQTLEYEAKALYRGEENTFAAGYENATRIIGKTIRPLFLARPIKWLQLFYMNLANSYTSIIPVILLMLFAVYIFFKRQKKIIEYQSLLYFFSLLILGNLFLVSISSHSIRRFFMYYDIILVLMLLLIFCNNNNIKKYIQLNE